MHFTAMRPHMYRRVRPIARGSLFIVAPRPLAPVGCLLLMTDKTLKGRLVFKQAGELVPLHNMRLVVSVPHLLTSRATEVVTDLDGRFSVSVAANTDHIELALFDQMHRFDDAAKPVDEWVQVATVNVAVAGRSDVGNVMVSYWPYRSDAPTPRAGVIDEKGKLPQSYTKGYMHTLEMAIAKSIPTQLGMKGRLALHDKMGLADVQKHYPPALTMKVDEKAKNRRSRSGAWLADQLLNGFDIELHVGRDADDPKRLRTRIQWDLTASKIGEPAFDVTQVDVVMEDRGGELCATRIRLEIFSPDGQGGFLSPRRVDVKPGDSDWEAAKRAVRCQYLLHGGIDGHIGGSHFQTEQATVAVYRNLRRNPVRRVLTPHLQEIVAQDHDVDGFAWGPTGILVSQSGLKTTDLVARFQQLARRRCWSTFSPRTALHATHRYAKAGALFWDLLTQHLTSFFAEQKASIVEQWPEVLRMSDDLVRNSLPYRSQPDDPHVVPADRNELDHPGIARATVDGVVRSVRPITTSATPSPEDMDRLLQFCRYVIYEATFNHSWTHDGQTDASGELGYAVFGLRGGSLGAEDDPAINPPPAMLVESLAFNSLGASARYGLLLADEERDVPPRLKQLLLTHKEDFAALGVDVGLIRSRINI